MDSYLEISKSKLYSNKIKINGYKHAAITVLCASLAIDNKINLYNAPNIKDTKVMVDIIQSLGGSIKSSNNVLSIEHTNLNSYSIPQELNKLIHGSIYLLPVVLGKMQKVNIGMSGGCQIGDINMNGNRPYKHMIKVLERFGANFIIRKNMIKGYCNQYHGCEIDIMEFSSKDNVLSGPLCSGATKTAILASLFVESGEVIIKNPYLKPDVTELLEFIKTSGFDVKWDKNTIIIGGKNTALDSDIIDHYLISDVSEIITYIALSVYTETPILLNNITVNKVKSALAPELKYLDKMNIKLHWEENTLKILSAQNINNVDIEIDCMSIYSDSQPFIALILTKAKNISEIRDNVWVNRFSYANELRKLGLMYKVEENKLIIHPSNTINGAILNATDLRCAAVLLISALSTPGTTKLYGYEHLERGYENFIGTLTTLGANINIIKGV